MTPASRYIYAVSFILVAAGFLLPLWPLSALGVALSALSGRSIFALLVGVLLDIAYGAPTGTLHYAVFPFGLLALVCILARRFGARYFLSRSVQEKI